jgi:hypothetical protein
MASPLRRISRTKQLKALPSVLPRLDVIESYMNGHDWFFPVEGENFADWSLRIQKTLAEHLKNTLSQEETTKCT